MSVYEKMSLVDSKYFLSEINWSPRVYSHNQQPNQEKKMKKISSSNGALVWGIGNSANFHPNC